MKVLLLNPPVFTEETYGKFAKVGSTQPFLGLCYLAAVLKRAGFTVKILDTILLKLNFQDILKEIDDFKPDIVGMSITTLSSLRADLLAKRIKERFPEIKLIAGGPHISEYTKSFFAKSFFAIGVIGEGENTFLELCTVFKNGRSYSSINGLMYKNDSGEVLFTAPRAFEHNLDRIPFPARELLPPLQLYRPSALYHKRIPVTQMLTSRGCPGQCIFCETPFGKTVRYHSNAYVVEEMLMLKRDYAMKEIMINDDTFVIDKGRTSQICALIRKHKLNIIWSCNVRANILDYDILAEMKASGCWLIMPGVESGNQKILNLLKKGITLEQVRKTCEWAHRLGIQVKPSFIIGNPGETIETINETIQFAKSLKTHYPSFTLFTPFPGTKAYEMTEQYGIISEDTRRFALSSMEPSFVPNGLTEEIIKKKQAQAFRALYLDPAMLWRHLRAIDNVEDIYKVFNAALTMLKV